MRNKYPLRPHLCLLAISILTACGMSLYRPLGAKETSVALREETLVQLNAGEYSEAEQSAAKLWKLKKTNDTASLYALALASTAGIGLFDLVVNAIKQQSSATTQSNDIFNSLSNVLPKFTDEQLLKIQQSIEILDSAPNKNSGGLLFQLLPHGSHLHNTHDRFAARKNRCGTVNTRLTPHQARLWLRVILQCIHK